ncbi:glycine dehydrogenase (decarboxylating) [Spirochaetota bacterium]|nr:glycine dehydrogenase (decarboxylating) [Spirochaetota bacterium]
MNPLQSTATRAEHETKITCEDLNKFSGGERTFASRHLGPEGPDVEAMLKALDLKSLAELITKSIPSNILIADTTPSTAFPMLARESEQSEQKALTELAAMMNKNEVWRSYIGLGYYGTIVPPPILRNMFENPGWYTSYTPYQAEISQGRLEMLINFQTMICDLTGMDIANASLLDEATAAAEAMTIMQRTAHDKTAFRLYVSEDLFPQTRAVLATRAAPLGIDLWVGSYERFSEEILSSAERANEFFGALLSQQSITGGLNDLAPWLAELRSANLRVSVAADVLAMLLVEPPGKWGADIVYGSAQRLGVPVGFGGPHAAFLATKDAYKRHLPGRVIGLSKDAEGNPAYRMALQTREQHIRREKATSNICTAQALLANMAAAYSIYHGTAGLKNIATRVHSDTTRLFTHLRELAATYPTKGLVLNESFFDTLTLLVTKPVCSAIKQAAAERKINLRYGKIADLGDFARGLNTKTATSNKHSYEEFIAFSLDETVTEESLIELEAIFALGFTGQTQQKQPAMDKQEGAPRLQPPTRIPKALHRTSAALNHEIFNIIHSETQMLRYLGQLEQKDISLRTSMIPLGSCTMKLNAVTEMLPLSWETVNAIHPMAPAAQAQGYQAMLVELMEMLKELTGFAGISLQPNSGAQGEYAGLMAIRSYHHANGEKGRTTALIPISAHGTNPASAVMAGFQPVFVACVDNGDIDREDFSAKCEQYKETLGALMITYPSTHGVFEADILWMIEKIHECGGQVYMDGANMNAQIGFTSPGKIKADVCHLNLHKTFAIPHGGGGPGMGPIGVAKHLIPYLPEDPFCEVFAAEKKSSGTIKTGAVSAAPYGSASILVISYLYIKMLGLRGLKQTTMIAILNANYLRKRLEHAYKILYTARNGFVAHEMIIDVREFKETAGIAAEDIAKRLMDYGFHAPTMSWPVAGTLMIEPTESEDKGELDRFVEALLSLRREIKAIETGKWPRDNNPIKNAPHTAMMIAKDDWSAPYTREEAVYPLPWLRNHKYWPPVARIDNVYGDRNLFCVCPPLSAYEDAEPSEHNNT